MGFIFFIATIVFLILWLKARTNLEDSHNSSGNFSEYSQGYWDGYRAFGEKAQQLIDRPDSDVAGDLQKLIVTGERGDVAEYALAEVASPQQSTYQADAGQEIEPIDEAMLEQQLEKQQERDVLKNLNILLYVASFLIVGAAALFVTLVMPAGIKLFSLIFVTLAFYVTGLVLHARSARLKPAATAFVGTGLAILPFVGFALTSLGGMSGEVAWLITSLIGLAAYGVAAARLQSELISYLTMAFVISLALSAVSVLSLSIMWYFIAVMGVSLLCNVATIVRPDVLPKIFVTPVDQTSRFTTPIALVASLFVATTMDIFMYQVLYGLATAHYLAIWLMQREWVYELAVRALAHITLLIVAADVTKLLLASPESRLLFGVWVVGLAAAQVVYSLVRVRPCVEEEIGQVERVIIGVALFAMGCAQTLWLGSEYIYEMTAVNLLLIGAGALAATLRLREAGWAYIGLGVSLVLPFVVLRGVAEPTAPYEVIAGGFAILGLGMLAALDRYVAAKRSAAVCTMMTVSVGLYACMAAASGLLSEDRLHLMWAALLAGGIFIGLSYVMRSVVFEVVGTLFGVMAIISGTGLLGVDQNWHLVIVALVSAAALLAGSAWHYVAGEVDRRSSLLVVAAGMLSLLVFTAGNSIVASQVTAVIILLAAAVAGVGVLAGRRGAGDDTSSYVARFAYLIYPFLGLLVAWDIGTGWVALVFAVMTGVLWVSSYAEKIPGTMIAGNIGLALLLATLWLWLEFDVSWMMFGVAWLASAVFYALYWLAFDKKDNYRQWVALGSIWCVLGASAFVYIWFSDPLFVVAAAGSLLAGSVLLAVQGYLDKKYSYIETAAYIVTFAAQRITEVLIPETNMVVYAHWWAAVIGIAALLQRAERQLRVIIALGCITGSTGIYALAGQAGYPLIFLIEHLLILTAGALLRASWVMWWGLVATILAVLYFLREYSFLTPLFLGVLLILFVIWRLTRMGDSRPAE